MSDSIQRVLEYLDTLAVGDTVVHPVGGNVIHAAWNITPDKVERRELRVNDLTDLVRRAVLCDSLADEIDRQATEIHRLRSLLPDEPGIIE